MKTSEKDFTIFETQIVQRSFDNKWERVCRVLDTDNTYEYVSESGLKMSYIPEKWITFGVYDALMEIV